jgi:3'-5' exoribonuclease
MSPQQKKELFVTDIVDNQKVVDLFLVKEASRAETKAGNPYLIITLMDRTGEIGGRIWQDADRYLSACEPGTIVTVNGVAQSYKNILQIKIDSVRAVGSAQESEHMQDFLPSAPDDTAAMAKEVSAFVKSIDDPHLKALLSLFFQPGDFFNTFQKAPAAKRMHHAYFGGLLEHTLAVTRLADTMAGLYPAIDRSLLITGALLHDIGKIEEFSYEIYPFDYTDKGRLVGHLVLGVEMIQARVQKIKDFPEQILTHLQHLILSHHGRHEFGSPALPMTLEAFVLSFIDDIDAKINYLGRLSGQARDGGYQWTDFQKTLERFLYVRGEEATHTEPADEQFENEAPAAKPGKSAQQNLFG